MIKLENWSCVNSDSPYTAPELRKLRLQGVVIGHGRIKDKTFVCTSVVKDVDGRIIRTRNSTYILGKIDPGYREFLKKTKPEWNWRTPIEVK